MNSLKYFLLILSSVFMLNDTFGQFNFQHLIGGSDHDRAQTIFNAYDGGFIINGASFSFGVGNVDATLIKTDNQGQINWSFAYGTSEYDNSEFALETFDHKIVCAGRSNISPGFPTAAIIFKTDSAGHLLWSKSYGGTGDDNLVQIIETSDSGYAAIGNSKSLSSGLSDILLIRTNIFGDTIFTRSYGTTEDEAGLSLIQLPDNGFIISGRQVLSTGPVSDGLLLRTDSLGNLLWTKQYGGALWEEFVSVKLITDTNYIVTGSTTSFNGGNFDILLMKTDSAGNVQWSKTFGKDKTDAGYDIHVNSDLSFVISGYTESLGYGHIQGGDSSNIFLMKTNENGDLLWMQTYGDGLQDEAFRSAKANDGGYLISGFTTNYIFSDSSQMLFIKTNSLGLTGCHEENVDPDDSLINMPFQSVNFNQLSGLPVNNIILSENSFSPSTNDACLFESIDSKELSENSLKVFPNPFSNQIEISFNNNISSEQELLISDLCGKIIKSIKINFTPLTLDTDNLDAGVYIISLKTSNISGRGILVLKY